MVTADTGTMIFRGRSRTYAVSFYIDDVIGNKLLFNANGKAGSGSDNTLQFTNEDVVLQDIILNSATKPTVATGFTLYAGGVQIPQSATILTAIYDSVLVRSIPPIGFKQNTLISAVEF